MSHPSLDRRSFLRTAAGWTALSAITGSVGYCGLVEPHWIEVVHRDLPIARLPRELAGKTLVQLSDIHTGSSADDYLIDAFRRVNRLKPDILVITGDFMTCDQGEQIDPTLRLVDHLEPARLGTIGVLGNHDYGRGCLQTQVADKLVVGLENQGIRMLRNESCKVKGLQIAGIDDVWAPRYAPEKVMPYLDRNAAQLVLCHNPDVCDLPVWHGYQGWILSGHTHGGQVNLPWYGPPIMPVQNLNYTSGAFDLGDGRRLYINRALGYHRRVRFNARPEITVFTLKRQTGEVQAV